MPLLNILTSMDMKLLPLHCDLSDIGYLSGGEAATCSLSSTEMVGTGEDRIGERKGGSKVGDS